MPSGPAAHRALYCPQCGHAVRPTGPLCPDCQAPIALPPPLAARLQSTAEALVPIRGSAAGPTLLPPSLWLQIGARMLDLAFLGCLTFVFLLALLRRVEVVPLAVLALWFVLDALVLPLFHGTIGMRLLGLAFADAQTGRPPDLVQALLRWFGALCHPLTLGATAILPWLDSEQRGWPERLAGLRIVERSAPGL